MIVSDGSELTLLKFRVDASKDSRRCFRRFVAASEVSSMLPKVRVEMADVMLALKPAQMAALGFSTG
jgi:hypothetical protein